MPAQRDPYTSPAMRAYANELGAWREEFKLTKAELSRLLGYTPQYVGQVEDCKNRPSRKFGEDCDTFFKTNGVFLRLWNNLNETRNLAMFSPGFPEYLERELLATSIRIFSALLIHGLFQTPEVVHAIMAGASDTETAAELADRRLERQEAILGRPSPPQIFLVIDECALRRLISSREIHLAQLQRILHLAELPHIMVQVVPQDRGYYPGLGGSLTILGFNDGSGVGYVESGGVGVVVDQPDRVAAMDIRYDLLRGYALPVRESREMIKAVMENYESRSADEVAEE